MSRPRIAITMGDPAGIGPEICLRLLSQPARFADCLPVIIGDAAVLRRVAESLKLPMPAQVISSADWPHIHSRLDDVAVWDCQAIDSQGVTPGVVSAATGKASYEYIMAAIGAATAGEVAAVVTGPIHKEALAAANIPYPGHTEIFADKTHADQVCMMMTSDQITCSLVTTHVGYRDVPELLTRERILAVMHLSHEALVRLHGKPIRMVVCGLNPHAGEGGLFGAGEEEKIIRPAVEEALKRGLVVEGPLPPDTAFLPDRRRVTDCYICMYHDQGLIPLKTLAFDDAVNVTLGLPIVRTSVDHGTACDIAWQGKAQITSLAKALELAARMALV